jgi:copper transport protein
MRRVGDPAGMARRIEVQTGRLRRAAAIFLLATVAFAIASPPAGAHTGFESSDPSDGSVLDQPVGVITLVFTGDAEPTGGGFQVLEPTGEFRTPTEASTVDRLTWTLRFEPPLGGGVIGVRWMVKAPDAHPIEGSFSFTAPSAIGDSPDGTGSGPLPAALDVDETAQLERFLDTGSDAGTPTRVAAFARFVTLVGTLIGVGGLVFSATTMRGGRRDVRHVMFWVRRAGLLVVAGSIVEFAAQMVIEDAGRWSALWSPSAAAATVAGSTFGLAAVLRLSGGLALAAGSRLETVDASGVADPVVSISELIGVGSGAATSLDLGGFSGPDATSSPNSLIQVGDHAWRANRGSLGAAVGALAVVGAHLFDGHTVTKGNRVLTGVVDAVHVAGGAVWAGGVFMLVSVLWRRHREGRELRARQLAVRFSVVASIALVVVALAGVSLTIIVLDSPSELWSTDWGRVLIAKTAFVAVAASAGGYNHKVLIPLMDSAPDDAALAHRFRRVVTGEAAALAAVIAATAFLMGASL